MRLNGKKHLVRKRNNPNKMTHLQYKIMTQSPTGKKEGKETEVQGEGAEIGDHHVFREEEGEKTQIMMVIDWTKKVIAAVATEALKVAEERDEEEVDLKAEAGEGAVVEMVVDSEMTETMHNHKDLILAMLTVEALNLAHT